MSELSLMFILALLGTAVFIDLRSYRIPNILVVAVLLLGLVAQITQHGFSGLFAALAGVGIGVLLLLPFYSSGSMGAGDVKLMGAVGALLGPLQALQAVLATLVFGGAMALLVVLCSRHSKLFFSRYAHMATTWIRTGQFIYQPCTAGDPAAQRFAYAAAIALGTVFVLYLNNAFDALVLL